MSKQADYFARINQYKERFRYLSTEAIRERLTYSALYKEAAIALREVLEEREQAAAAGEHPDRAV